MCSKYSYIYYMKANKKNTTPKSEINATMAFTQSLATILIKDTEMSRGATKRLEIFNKYSKQLSSLVKLGLCDLKLEYKKTFICPTCLHQFSEDDLDISKENFLTLEDAPPKSLGGS